MPEYVFKMADTDALVVFMDADSPRVMVFPYKPESPEAGVALLGRWAQILGSCGMVKIDHGCLQIYGAQGCNARVVYDVLVEYGFHPIQAKAFEGRSGT